MDICVPYLLSGFLSCPDPSCSAAAQPGQPQQPRAWDRICKLLSVTRWCAAECGECCCQRWANAVFNFHPSYLILKLGPGPGDNALNCGGNRNFLLSVYLHRPSLIHQLLHITDRWAVRWLQANRKYRAEKSVLACILEHAENVEMGNILRSEYSCHGCVCPRLYPGPRPHSSLQTMGGETQARNKSTSSVGILVWAKPCSQDAALQLSAFYCSSKCLELYFYCPPQKNFHSIHTQYTTYTQLHRPVTGHAHYKLQFLKRNLLLLSDCFPVLVLFTVLTS